MTALEEPYLQLIRDILEKGHQKGDRTKTGTTSLFGYQMRFDLSQGFPLLTTKKVPFGLIKSELLWFLRGVCLNFRQTGKFLYHIILVV